MYALSPKVYIFDEPSANLDYAAAQRLAKTMKGLKEAGCTILVVEHRFYYLRELLDRAFLIQDGRIVQCFTPAQFCQLPEEARIQYGLRTAYPERAAGRYRAAPLVPSPRNLLQVRDLAFGYEKGVMVFQNLSFEACSGDIIGILGHNGAGKTTLLSILTGLRKEQRGSICCNGKKLSPRGRRALSYLVMQDTDYQLFASSVAEELSLCMKGDCAEKVTETLEALELSAYRDCHPAALSGGQKQRVTIGAAMVKDSPVICFDEPTSGLDYDSMVRVSRLMEQLAEAGGILFVVSHDFEFISRTCSAVLRLDRQDVIQKEALTPENPGGAFKTIFSWMGGLVMFQKVFAYAGPHKRELYKATFLVLLSVLMGVLPFVLAYQVIAPLVLGGSRRQPRCSRTGGSRSGLPGAAGDSVRLGVGRIPQGRISYPPPSAHLPAAAL